MSRELHSRPGRRLARAETALHRGSVDAIRAFLQSARRGLLEGDQHGALVAAGELPQLPVMVGWWAAAVDEHIAPAVREAWLIGYRATTSLDTVARSLDAMGEYVLRATDRLSRTVHPLIPEQAWNQLQVVLSEELALGSSQATISRRIAAEMRWDVDTVFWEQRKERLAGQIDDILDPIGPPGDPAREAARLNDPQVRELQRQNAAATRKLDAEKSTWQVRADRIARTESTGAYNGGSFDAGLRVGAQQKRWMSSRDHRVRSTHARADGQTTGLQNFFVVGGAQLMHPGEFGGPAEEVINCRCTMTFPDVT